MDKELEMLNRILDLRTKTKCTKFVGAITTEIIRKELVKEGSNVSNRDVFIEGLPHELDLLVLKKGAKPTENLFYKPEQVLAVLEIKFRGAYSKEGIEKVGETFNAVRKINKKIKCFYIMFSENIRYKYFILEKKLGDQSFLLLKRESSLENAIKRGRINSTGDWGRLIVFLKNQIKK